MASSGSWDLPARLPCCSQLCPARAPPPAWLGTRVASCEKPSLVAQVHLFFCLPARVPVHESVLGSWRAEAFSFTRAPFHGKLELCEGRLAPLLGSLRAAPLQAGTPSARPRYFHLPTGIPSFCAPL